MSQSNYHTKKWFSEDLLAVEMKKTVYLGLSILEIKTLMYEFWCDYIKPKYQNIAKLCYMNTDSFIIHIKTEDFYKSIAGHNKNRYDTSNHEVHRPLPKGTNKKVIDLMKDELGRKIITELVALRPKTHSYLTDDNENVKKLKE